ncbi:MAG: hypothetical protein WA648_05830, partial [Methylocella sp.]
HAGDRAKINSNTNRDGACIVVCAALSASDQSGGLSQQTPDALHLCGRLLPVVTKDDLVDLSPREACHKTSHADDITREANDYAGRSSLIAKKSARSTGPPSNAPHERAATHGLINPVQQIAGGHKFLYLLSERHQFATAHRFAIFA